MKHCVVLDTWINLTGDFAPKSNNDHKIAQIIPKSTKASLLGYFFGQESDNAEYVRNSLPLHATIEAAFDDQRITFVPAETSPIEGSESGKARDWKMVVLDTDLMDSKVVWFSGPDETSKSITFKELDGKKLTFLSSATNPSPRPATRYMYARHCVAYAHSRNQGWSELQRRKCPSGKI